MKPIAVGCCAFAGGFTWGLREAGIETIAQLEFPDNGVKPHLKTARANFDHPIYSRGPQFWPIEELAFMEPDIVYAQPPCAPWSPAGYGPTRGTNKHDSDPRVAWTKAAFTLIEKLDPKIFVYESVQPTFKKTRESFLDPVALDCNLNGMSCYHILLNGAFVGVPHNRKRYFFVASKFEIPWIAPAAIAPPTALETLESVPFDISDVPHWPRPIDQRTWEHDISFVNPGETLLSAWKRLNPPETWTDNGRGQVSGRPAFGSYRLHPDKSPRTFFGSYTILHPTKERPLTFREMKAIAGYPPEFVMTGSYNSGMVQMGQAVLPPVGKWIGGQMMRGLIQREQALGNTTVLHYQ